MKVINGKKFYKRAIDAAVRVDCGGWDSYNGRNTQWYSLWYDPQSGYVCLDAKNSGDCFGDYDPKEYASLEEFFAAAVESERDVGTLLGTIDEADPVRVEVAERWAAFCAGRRRSKKRKAPDRDPRIRAVLMEAAPNYTDRDKYIADLSRSPVWGESIGEYIPPERLAAIGRIYDATHCTINDVLDRYNITRNNLAAYFGIPYRTVQDWCLGKRQCPSYVVAMMCEILDRNK